MPEVTNPCAWMWIVFAASIFIFNIYLFFKNDWNTKTGTQHFHDI